MAVTAQSTVQVQEKPAEAQTRAPVYEMVAGKPIYYRGYQRVLRGELPPEAVMGSSKLQWRIILALLRFLLRAYSPTEYDIATNEAGFKTGDKSWRALDIALFRRKDVEAEGYTDEYVRTPPLLVIEVDTKADLSHLDEPMTYFIEKAQELLDAGVQVLVWIFTKPHKVWVCRPGEPWLLMDWDAAIALPEGVTLNLARLLEAEGVLGRRA